MAKSADAFRTIREVADWLDVAAHVLRFWESKFPQIKPVKRAGGRRYYRPADMQIVGGIKVLLHDRGMTIRGVKKMISEDGLDAVTALSPPLETATVTDVLVELNPDTAWAADAEAESTESQNEAVESTMPEENVLQIDTNPAPEPDTSTAAANNKVAPALPTDDTNTTPQDPQAPSGSPMPSLSDPAEGRLGQLAALARLSQGNASDHLGNLIALRNRMALPSSLAR